jgi:DNA-binding CsgD family transcriptional regulator
MSLKEEIEALRAQGLTYPEIQDQLKCSKGTIAYHLGEGQKEKTLKRQNDARAKISRFIAAVKDNRHCLDCGIAYRHWQMEFDHLGDKEFTIAQFRSHTSDIVKVKAEIEKCELVCRNCHGERTYVRRVEKDEE